MRRERGTGERWDIEGADKHFPCARRTGYGPSQQRSKKEKDSRNIRLYSTVQKEMHDSLEEEEEEDFY